ncbi:SAM-dependent methyltransferase [Paraburkholderia sp. GAS199]|uniref:class I SAM-dependent methyltransferase n=1 Tax=Paraburkholderia sp. GAS199 TaxID=3035126 RepID=UPI003D1B643C
MAQFGDALAKFYEEHMVPMVFRPYAQEMTSRAIAASPESVLEIAAGTGVVTALLSAQLAPEAALVATDISQSMMNVARKHSAPRVHWQAADAHSLPFKDESFDVIVCQFGVMFFSEKAKAYAEINRVLRRGGRFIFSVWAGTKDNDLVATVNNAVGELFPEWPLEFLESIPHGYHDYAAIRSDLKGGGFTGEPRFDAVASTSEAPSASHAAAAYCKGTPLRNEIEARGAGQMEAALRKAEQAVREKFGVSTVQSRMLAHFVEVDKA